ncbi:hypothetical protein B5X24_HaOG205483 [Helicoverpa armigera]|nr:hypothetical protein B5X24_HaOG205483 [Helicoverpa armigera]
MKLEPNVSKTEKSTRSEPVGYYYFTPERLRAFLKGLHTKAADPAGKPGGFRMSKPNDFAGGSAGGSAGGTTAAACGVLVIAKYSMKAGGQLTE